MKLSIECEREADGRWIAEIVALRTLADRIEHGEAKPLDISISLAAA